METKEIQPGDEVAIHYTGKFENGEVFDATPKKSPYRFVIGKGTVLPAFESKLIGLREGAHICFCIPAEEAYGPLHGELMIEIPRRNLPLDIEPEVGMRLKVPFKFRKEPYSIKVLAVSDLSITVDANHPLAGRDLYYDVEVVSVKRS